MPWLNIVNLIKGRVAALRMGKIRRAAVCVTPQTSSVVVGLTLGRCLTMESHPSSILQFSFSFHATIKKQNQSKTKK